MMCGIVGLCRGGLGFLGIKTQAADNQKYSPKLQLECLGKPN